MSQAGGDFTVTLQATQLLTGTRYKVAVYGFAAGRYGSQVSATVDTADQGLPSDPEELLSRLLSLVSHLVYHA